MEKTVCFTFGFYSIILSIFAVQGIAKSEKTYRGWENSSNLYLVLGRRTWMDGLNDCKQIYNMTMASSFDINEKSKLYFNVENHFPLWIYAFEVVLSSGKVLRIRSNEVSKFKNTYLCSNQDGVSDYQAVNQYVGNEKIPKYSPTATTRNYSSKSPGQTTKQDSENADQSTTDKSSTNEVPIDQEEQLNEEGNGKSNNGMLIGVIIGLCLALAVLVIITTILIRKKGRNAQEKNETDQTGHGNNSSQPRLNTNIENAMYESLNDLTRTDQSNTENVAYETLDNSRLTDGPNIVNEMYENADCSKLKERSKTLNAMYETLDDTTRTGQSNTGNVAYETLDNSRRSSGSNIVNDMYENANSSKSSGRSKTLNAMYETLDHSKRIGSASEEAYSISTERNEQHMSGMNMKD